MKVKDNERDREKKRLRCVRNPGNSVSMLAEERLKSLLHRQPAEGLHEQLLGVQMPQDGFHSATGELNAGTARKHGTFPQESPRNSAAS